ncbi:MAG: hypothetical protein JWO13_2494 [Acidobacteriales bacterium]|nr:hypothetical protein [Terriglobales bacterium]
MQLLRLRRFSFQNLILVLVLATFQPSLNAAPKSPSALLTMADHQVALTECGVLAKAGTTYILQNDVSSPGTCFAVQADRITLDLNGHTITYGTAESGGQHRHAVVGIACWAHDLDGNPCGGSASDLTIANGKILQATTAAPFSHAIRVGQINGLKNLTVEGVEITVSAPNTIPIYTTFSKGGAKIYKNVIHNNVTTITNRGAFQGMSIKLDNEVAATLPNLIHDNVIIGGAQAGIRETNSAGSKIYNNHISMRATYSNDFCIDAPGSKIEIYGNNCHPAQGRGLHLNGSDLIVHDNVIEVTEQPNNMEYGGEISSIIRKSGVVTIVTKSPHYQRVGNPVTISGVKDSSLNGSFTVSGTPSVTILKYSQAGPDSSGVGGRTTACELNGAYGIQIESDLGVIGNVKVFGNKVTANAAQCDAVALKMTNIEARDVVEIYDNQFVAKRVGNTGSAAHAISVEIFDGTKTSISKNIFISDTDLGHIGYRGGSNLRISNSTVAKGSNSITQWQLFGFGNQYGGGTAIGEAVQDPIFKDGAGVQFGLMAASTALEEFYVNWSLSLRVVTQTQVAVSGVNVIIKDHDGKEVYSGVTDSNGNAIAFLPSRRVYNTATTVISEPKGPYAVSMSKSGCSASQFTLDLKDKTEMSKVLNCN